MKYTTPEQAFIPGGPEEVREFLDPNHWQKPNTVVLVVDAGDAMSTITVPTAGLVTIENVVETIDDLDVYPTTVGHNPDGTYYSIRNMKNA